MDRASAKPSTSRDAFSMTDVSALRQVPQGPMYVGGLRTPGLLSCALTGECARDSSDGEEAVDPLLPMWVRSQKVSGSDASTLSELPANGHRSEDSGSTEGDSWQLSPSRALCPMQGPRSKQALPTQKPGTPRTHLSVKATTLVPTVRTGEKESAFPSGGDQRTTVMMRNLPTTLCRAKLIDLLNSQGLSGQYDLVYLPMDFVSACNFGYAFVNCTSHQQALNLWQVFNGFTSWPSSGCRKVCAVCWGSVQGLRANVARYHSNIMCREDVPDDYKPIIFQDGQQAPLARDTPRLPKTSRSKAYFRRNSNRAEAHCKDESRFRAS